MSVRQRYTGWVVTGIVFMCTITSPSLSRDQGKAMALDSLDGLELHNVTAAPVTFKGRKALRVTIDPETAKKLAAAMKKFRSAPPPAGAAGPAFERFPRFDHLTIIEDLEFQDGVIEVELAGEPAKNAPGLARGFVGVAWRVQPDREQYDCIYLRPANGRAEDQERRNHSVQYLAHPDHTWFKLRRETPGKYESYVDLVPGEWTKVKIEVRGDKARLYVHGNEQPTLIINDVKSGPDGKGAIALWIEGTTVAHFSNLRVSP